MTGKLDEELANTDPTVLRVFIVRHGQTEFNRKKILQGHLNVPLNETGYTQADLIGSRLANVHIDRIVSSDLTRCQQTAQPIIAKNINEVLADELHITENLRERAMGPHIEGKTIPEAMAYAQSQGVDNFRHYGEALGAVTHRLDAEWTKLTTGPDSLSHKNVVLVTHGGVIRRWLPYLHKQGKYGLKEGLTEEDLKVPYNTSLTVVDFYKHESKHPGMIQMFGDTAHLGAQLKVKDQDLR
ncbi:hypothetical protein BABINDRAFT_160053 [Babjeviella inositovora NRRL Y-12698]|uniref:Phosphoglycerate mutase-like protein n=1 Tax=Babjeviella inositovora NRRL Y-12698 TaxID=984486 RepID=A0A1E3QVW9_9ASCO|nr:uncharacterized protein BABINDRAFT_160053 [Babjeviella inositovora NRRL Y-12698]ODQ81816.1 hypothetical protein BABINDRAFT_160053 [Babjeviella inositovora NRRL Y-12698]